MKNFVPLLPAATRTLRAGAITVAGACLSLGGLTGCGKPDPVVTAHATPSPTPDDERTDSKEGHGDDLSAKNIRHKADQAANSLEKFLKEQNPKMRDKAEKLVGKMSDRLGVDKDHWRQKLEEERQKLGPQIDQLRAKLGEIGDDQNKAKLKAQLDKLQDKSQDTDKKLAQLEAAGADAWKQFKARLKADEAKDKQDKPPTDEAADDADDRGDAPAVPAGKAKATPRS